MGEFDDGDFGLSEEEMKVLGTLSDPDAVSKDKFNWDQDAQREILSLLMQDRYFLIQSIDLIKAGYFTNESHQLISRILFNYFKKYKAVPSKIQIIQEIKDILASKDSKVRVSHLGELNTVYEYFLPGAGTRDYYLDKITNFAKAMSMKTAFSKCLEEVEKSPEDEATWSKVHEILKGALDVDRNFDIGLDYFQTYEERYERMKEKVDKGEIFITGFKEIDESLSGGGLSRGEIGSIVGLCFGKGQKVLMYDGSIKKVEDVVVGDLLMGDDSAPRKVLELSKGNGYLYKVIPTKGNSYIVNENHILSLKNCRKKPCRRKKKDGTYYTKPNIDWSNHPSRVENTNIFNISVKNYLNESEGFKVNMKGWRTGVEWKKRKVKIDPYILGVWLGDGDSDRAAFTNKDEKVVDCILNEAEKRKLSINKIGNIHFSLVHDKNKTSKNREYLNPNTLLQDLKSYNLICNYKLGEKSKKHIPDDYKINDRKTRLQLLAGIIDSDGSLSKSSCYELVFKNKVLANDVVFLARSLGFAAYISKCNKTCCNNGKVGVYYRISISGNCHEIPVKIQRKKALKRKQIKDVNVNGIKVESIGYGDYYGFRTDGNHLFLLDDFTVTHNSGSGKSLFLVKAALENLNLGKKVLYISLEIDQDKVAERFDAQITNPDPYTDHNGITIKNLLDNQQKVFDSLNEYLSEKDNHQLMIVKQFPAGDMDVPKMRAYFSQLGIQGFKPDLVIIDYIGEMKDYPNMATWESRQRIVRDLRGFAVEENVCVFTAMQPEKRAKEAIRMGGIIDDDMLADSYGQIRPLDALWSLNQLQTEKECGLARIFVIKHRFGKSRFTIYVQFDYDTLRIRQISENRYKTIKMTYENTKKITAADHLKVEEESKAKIARYSKAAAENKLEPDAYDILAAAKEEVKKEDEEVKTKPKVKFNEIAYDSEPAPEDENS